MAASFTTKSLLTCKSFNLQYAFRPLIQVNYKIADNQYHPLHEKVLKRLEAQKKNQLIINITASIKKTSAKAVVRKKAMHRVREAIYQVLKEKGYEKDGKAGNGGSDLVGTLAFRTTTETVLTPWEELKKEVRGALGKWMVLQQKSSNPAKNVARKDARPRIHPKRHGGGAEGVTGDWGYGGGAREEVSVEARRHEKRAGGIENRRGGSQGRGSQEGRRDEIRGEPRNQYRPGGKESYGRAGGWERGSSGS